MPQEGAVIHSIRYGVCKVWPFTGTLRQRLNAALPGTDTGLGLVLSSRSCTAQTSPPAQETAPVDLQVGRSLPTKALCSLLRFQEL